MAKKKFTPKKFTKKMKQLGRKMAKDKLKMRKGK